MFSPDIADALNPHKTMIALQSSRSLSLRRHLTISALAILLFCAAQSYAWQPAEGPLKTRWTSQVSPQNALPEYPRPQMVRKEWLSLNGVWDFAVTPKDAKPEEYRTEILVPYPVESALSGVMKPVTENDRVYYRRMFEV